MTDQQSIIALFGGCTQIAPVPFACFPLFCRSLPPSLPLSLPSSLLTNHEAMEQERRLDQINACRTSLEQQKRAKNAPPPALAIDASHLGTGRELLAPWRLQGKLVASTTGQVCVPRHALRVCDEDMAQG